MQTLIPQNKLDFWIKQQAQVMLIGKHGIGKTHVIMDVAKRHNLRMKYFSCATLDPWVDFIGVPKVRNRTVERNGKQVKVPYLDLVRPEAFAFDEIEMIFLDELNRAADEKILNAVLELVQFGSINGKKFKNLKYIWAAINPHAADTGDVAYQVRELDPALLSRFKVKYELPFDVADDYMEGKYGKQLAYNAAEFWRDLTDEQQNEFPPRSLDYALEWVQAGGDVEDVLPKSIKKASFLTAISQAAVNTSQMDTLMKASGVRPSRQPLTAALLTSIRSQNDILSDEAFEVIGRIRVSSNEEIMAAVQEIHDTLGAGDINKATRMLVCSMTKDQLGTFVRYWYPRTRDGNNLMRSRNVTGINGIDVDDKQGVVHVLHSLMDVTLINPSRKGSPVELSDTRLQVKQLPVPMFGAEFTVPDMLRAKAYTNAHPHYTLEEALELAQKNDQAVQEAVNAASISDDAEVDDDSDEVDDGDLDDDYDRAMKRRSAKIKRSHDEDGDEYEDEEDEEDEEDDVDEEDEEDTDEDGEDDDSRQDRLKRALQSAVRKNGRGVVQVDELKKDLSRLKREIDSDKSGDSSEVKAARALAKVINGVKAPKTKALKSKGGGGPLSRGRPAR